MSHSGVPGLSLPPPRRQELKPKPGDQTISHQLLTNFLLLASKNKGNMERALQEFTNIASSETYKDHVGAICGMATAYMLLKQVPGYTVWRDRVISSYWIVSARRRS